jgi:Ankyrin repeats (3 copies)
MTFFQARDALDAGDLPALTAILDEHPDVVHFRCHQGDWYESGYFAGATLLHHVAGNPIRCPLPANIVEIARLLLSRDAKPDGVAGLLLTSQQASEARVALPIIELLIEAGARVDLDRPDVLDDPLWNQAPATAEALIRRGSPMALRHAAALGRLDDVAELIDSADRDEREEALILASVRGQLASVRVLVSHGARGDRIGRHGPATALHEAANRGFAEIVAHLLDHGADPTVLDTRFGGTAAEWAEYGRPEDLPAMRALFGKRGV